MSPQTKGPQTKGPDEEIVSSETSDINMITTNSTST